MVYNSFGYGPEDFKLPDSSTSTLLQHADKMQLQQQIKACWDYFTQVSQEKGGYMLWTSSNVCSIGMPFKFTFRAPNDKSPYDRIRVVDLKKNEALWEQQNFVMEVPSGTRGSVTLDRETFAKVSEYRIFYERHVENSRKPLAENNVAGTPPPLKKKHGKKLKLNRIKLNLLLALFSVRPLLL